MAPFDLDGFVCTPPSLTLIPHPEESFSGGFEGPEKLLEMWFAENPAKSGPGLKSIPRELWEQMLHEVGCKVLSVVRSPGVDAYLLRYPYITTGLMTVSLPCLCFRTS
jgi:Adenosylmethionine decarboxylase